MKKIFILAGIVLFFVFLVMCWLFFGNFFNFAKDLGKGSENVLDEKTKFFGTWETTYIEGDERFVGYNGIYTFNTDGTGSISGLVCTWDLENGKLIINYYDGFSTLTYNYSFLNENTLSLTNSYGTLEFIKK